MADETVSTRLYPQMNPCRYYKDPNANLSAELTDAQAQPDTELQMRRFPTLGMGVIERSPPPFPQGSRQQ